MALTPLEFAVVVLAAFRATRLVVLDTIADTPRDWVARRLGWWGDGLASCSYCAGWWLSLAAYTLACVALGRAGDVPLLAHMIECWAVAGGQALLSAVDARLAE